MSTHRMIDRMVGSSGIGPVVFVLVLVAVADRPPPGQPVVVEVGGERQVVLLAGVLALDPVRVLVDFQAAGQQRHGNQHQDETLHVGSLPSSFCESLRFWFSRGPWPVALMSPPRFGLP